MQEVYVYLRYPAKILASFKLILSKPAGAATVVPAIALMPALTTPQKALILLACLFVIDFGTGIGASWVEFKKALPVTPGSGKRYLIQSSKLKLSGVKFIIYGLGCLIAAGFEWVFIAQEFEPHKALQKLSLTSIVIGFFCVIEFYSIVFENFKRMGFDVIQELKKMFKSGRDIYKTVKDDNNSTSDS
jgi:phage-related holin